MALRFRYCVGKLYAGGVYFFELQYLILIQLCWVSLVYIDIDSI